LLAGCAALLVGGLVACRDDRALDDPTCGATIRVIGTEGRRVTLEIANTRSDTIEIGGSSQASFVDATGTAMSAKMTPGTGDWFLPFSLPPASKRQVSVTLKPGGDPATLDRIEIPNSGASVVPLCTVKISGLAATAERAAPP
jgi:hypothetical protein